MKSKFYTGAIALSLLFITGAVKAAPVIIEIKPSNNDMTKTLQKAINRAARQSANGNNVILKLRPGTYNISRKASTPILYHISNTTSAHENPDATKHIGLYFKGISNLTVDAKGAKFITHGEMTPWVIDSCCNVTLQGFSLDAADPSVPEMTVVSRSDSSFVATTSKSSNYRISTDNHLYWTGINWEFTNGIAQVYNPETFTTLRCESPLVESKRVVELEPGKLEFIYTSNPPTEAQVGVTYQMRHSYRTEVAGFINRSADIKLQNLTLNFLGNFGIVAQYSENISYENITCAPDSIGDRTCAGFADFMQISGCKGDVLISNCYFSGAQDDPINVHGTHLRVINQPLPNQLVVRFMHHQTYGFESFFPGDTCSLVNDATLLPVGAPLIVRNARLINDYDMELTFDNVVKLPTSGKYVLENLTWTPSVKICDNTFKLTPTRGILITTCRPVQILRNKFYNIPMASILVADDARSWYESGAVKNLLIKENQFINCSSPQIWISPENSEIDPKHKVHSGIVIENNRFITTSTQNASAAVIQARSVDGLTIRNNTVNDSLNSAVILNNCSNVSIDNF